MSGARAAAEKWSRPSDVALDAATVLADSVATQRMLERIDTPPGISTARTAGYLQWRYSFGPLRYRALPLGGDLADGVIVFRVRGRGTATELTVCDVLAPPRQRVGRAIGYLLRNTGADYAIRTVGRGSLRAGFAPAPNLGPILTWREVCREGTPEMSDLALTLGDVELF